MFLEEEVIFYMVIFTRTLPTSFFRFAVLIGKRNNTFLQSRVMFSVCTFHIIGASVSEMLCEMSKYIS